MSLVLTEQERETLQRWARRPTSVQSLVLRSRIVLACAAGGNNKSVASEVGVNQATVGKWRRRFVALRLDGLVDEPRPGAPRTITDDQVERVIVKTLQDKPKDASHWSSRDMAKASGMTQTAIVRIWKAFGLKPWDESGFTLSNDPQFIDKVRDIVGIYLCPPEAAAVFCCDEKTQVQALNRTQPVLPMRPMSGEQRTCNYERNGTTSLFAALNLASGAVVHKLSRQHRTVEFVTFLNAVMATVDTGQEVHLIMDNVSTHKTPAVHTWLVRHPTVHLHFTPTYSSWLNLVERWFAELTTKWIKRGTHHSFKGLVASIRTWVTNWNNEPKPYIWHKTADEIFDSLASYCDRISDSRH